MLSKIACIATAAVIAVTAAAPAHAVVYTGRNGVELNGVTLNGTKMNGAAANGRAAQGIDANAPATQGTATGATGFAIAAIELPPRAE
jgi:hypothetical protein